MLRLLHERALLAISMLAVAAPALAQQQVGYYAAIAYSQATGKIGATYREARTEQSAQDIAVRNTGAPDAKAFIWGPNQWVAIATLDGHTGTAGFGRGATADEAQQKALDECGKKAHGNGYRVRLCIHRSGIQTDAKKLRIVAAAPPAKSKTGYFAAIAFSPSTGKIGTTAGEATTVLDAQKLAIKQAGAPDAKVYMWSDQWHAIAVSDGNKTIAGFAPGATREAAEKAALEQCRKSGHGAPCHIELSLYSAPAKSAAASGVAAETSPSNQGVTPASATQPAVK